MQFIFQIPPNDCVLPLSISEHDRGKDTQQQQITSAGLQGSFEILMLTTHSRPPMLESDGYKPNQVKKSISEMTSKGRPDLAGGL